MDLKYVKIVSWHVARPKDHADSSYCGRTFPDDAETADVAPWNEKGCETCGRIIVRLVDAAGDVA